MMHVIWFLVDYRHSLASSVCLCGAQSLVVSCIICCIENSEQPTPLGRCRCISFFITSKIFSVFVLIFFFVSAFDRPVVVDRWISSFSLFQLDLLLPDRVELPGPGLLTYAFLCIPLHTDCVDATNVICYGCRCFHFGGAVQCLSECNQYLFASVGTEFSNRRCLFVFFLPLPRCIHCTFSCSSFFFAFGFVNTHSSDALLPWLNGLLCFFLCVGNFVFIFGVCFDFWISPNALNTINDFLLFPIAFCYVHVLFSFSISFCPRYILYSKGFCS